MDSTRSQILEQVAAGQLSADDAARRLRPDSGPQLPPDLARRWLRVRVTNLHTQQAKVQVNLPMAWVAAGLRLGARYAPEVGKFDVAELVAALQAGASGRLIDVEDLEDGERVEIFVD